MGRRPVCSDAVISEIVSIEVLVGFQPANAGSVQTFHREVGFCSSAACQAARRATRQHLGSTAAVQAVLQLVVANFLEADTGGGPLRVDLRYHPWQVGRKIKEHESSF